MIEGLQQKLQVWSRDPYSTRLRLVLYESLDVIPFHLWHISGFTKSLMDYIENLCHAGLTMQQIETLLARNRAHLFYRLREQFTELSLACSAQVSEFPNFSSESM